MRSFNEYKNNQNGINSFFGSLMNYKNQAQILHLSTKSFSEHKALDEFYDSLTELTDSLIETYQGQYGLVTVEQKQAKYTSASDLLNNASKELKESRELFNKEDSHLHNILDEISSLSYRTLYKINNLK